MSSEVKKKNKLRFDKWSKKYDKSLLQYLVFNRSHNMFFKEMSPFLKGGIKILDIGCGTGKFAHRLSKLHKDLEVHGIDISEDMIKEAKTKVKNERIQFKVGDVEQLPYDANSFDMITCSHSFHHYPNQKKAIAEMHRVLKNEGKVMIIDGCRDKVLGKIIFGIVRMLEGKIHHAFENEMKNMLQSLGFSKIKQKKFNPIAPLLFTSGHVKKENKK